jgi:hypothetical protein
MLGLGGRRVDPFRIFRLLALRLVRGGETLSEFGCFFFRRRFHRRLARRRLRGGDF